MSNISEAQLLSFGEELEKLGSKWYARAGKVMENFGQRQLHSVTGWKPKGGIESIGGGAAGARKSLQEAKDVVGKQRAREAIKANVTADRMGLTSLPGMAKSLAKDPKGTVRAAWNQQWHGTSPLEKAVLVGLPAAGTVADVASEDDGRKGERIGAGLASTATGLLTGSMPFAGGAVASLGAGYVGGRLGRVADKLRSPKVPHVQAPPNPEDARGQSVPTERIMSPAATGQISEVTG